MKESTTFRTKHDQQQQYEPAIQTVTKHNQVQTCLAVSKKPLASLRIEMKRRPLLLQTSFSCISWFLFTSLHVSLACVVDCLEFPWTTCHRNHQSWDTTNCMLIQESMELDLDPGKSWSFESRDDWLTNACYYLHWITADPASIDMVSSGSMACSFVGSALDSMQMPLASRKWIEEQMISFVYTMMEDNVYCSKTE